MLSDAELQDILYRLDEGIAHWRDRAKLRQHINTQAVVIEAQARTIASLRAEVEAHDAALQARDAEIAALLRQTTAPPGWHKLFVATPTQNVSIAVNGVPVALHNGEAA